MEFNFDRLDAAQKKEVARQILEPALAGDPEETELSVTVPGFAGERTAELHHGLHEDYWILEGRKLSLDELQRYLRA